MKEEKEEPKDSVDSILQIITRCRELKGSQNPKKKNKRKGGNTKLNTLKITDEEFKWLRNKPR